MNTMTIQNTNGGPEMTFNIIQESDSVVLLTAGEGAMKSSPMLSVMPDGTLANSSGITYRVVRRGRPAVNRQGLADALRACTGATEVTVTDGGQTVTSPQPVNVKLMNALRVMTLTPHIAKYLKAHDPMALKQAQEAIRMAEDAQLMGVAPSPAPAQEEDTSLPQHVLDRLRADSDAIEERRAKYRG